MNESAFIDCLTRLPLHKGARGLKDDVAVLELGDETLIITHDMMVAGTHYLPQQDMADVAWKLLASNLSDLAAKGAQPLGIMLGHMLGDDDERFLDGLHEAMEHYNVPLLGGDTVAASRDNNGARSHGITAIGRATHTPVPSRSGAQIGDILWLVGEIGAAMLGYEMLKSGENGGHAAFTRPMARIGEGIALAPFAHAMMDVSDGLLLDAFRMAEASACSIAIDSKAVPIADSGRAMECMTWGDDYALLAALPTGTEPPVKASKIGQIEAQAFVPLFLDGEPIANQEGLGFRH